MDVYRELWKTVYCAVDVLRGSFFPMCGNEEWAINWAPPAGSTQQRKGGGGREDSSMLQTALNYLCYAGTGELGRHLIFIVKLGHCGSEDQDTEWRRRQEKAIN